MHKSISEIKEHLDFLLGEQTAPVVCLFLVPGRTVMKRLQGEFAALFPEFSSFYYDLREPVVLLTDTIRQRYVPAFRDCGEYVCNIIHLSNLHNYLITYDDKLKPQRSVTASNMNMYRERIFREEPYMLFIWLEQGYEREFVQMMPDFNDWITNRYRFEGEADAFVLDANKTLEMKTDFHKSLTAAQNGKIKASIAEWEKKLEKLRNDPDDLAGTRLRKSELHEMLAQEYNKIHDYNKAIDHALAARELIANMKRGEESVASLDFIIGNVYKNLHQFERAEQYYKAALQFYEIDTKSYVPNFAIILNSLGNLSYSKNDHTESEKYYLRALEIREKLYAENPKTNASDLAMLLNGLGALYSNKNAYPESEKYYLRALEIYERLYAENSEVNKPNLAGVLNNLGNLYSNKNAYPESEKYFLRALEIYERLYAENSEANKPYLASLLMNLGILYSNKNAYPESEKYFLRALEIYERLYAENPEANTPNLASLLNNLGILYFGKNAYPEAEKYYLRSLKIRENLYVENPEAYAHDLAISFYCIALLFKNQKKCEKAMIYANKAKSLTETHEMLLQEQQIVSGIDNIMSFCKDQKNSAEKSGNMN